MQPDSIYQLLNERIDVSRETFDRLKLYCDLLLKWQAKINLISNDTIPDVWTRHFLDSLQLTQHISNREMTIVDMGSGAGFPALVLAICGYKNIHCIESDAKKIAFLQEVSRITKSPVTLHHGRIEAQALPVADMVCARALADLDRLLVYSEAFVSRETICLFPKGKNYANELDNAKQHWSFEHVILPSITDPEAVILKLSNIQKRASHDKNPIHR
ncbi:MAG: 16S rRNA (guanine(527)-N(7))-methyltransferase RsmG [Rickettsiales bacterium]|nr:16S rRNA (guanine(527)-N(7))-methyltransferase RsmG [Rickettsiales bacterium]